MKDSFKTQEDFQEFCKTSMFCICGQVMSGFHMSGCARLRKIERRFMFCVCGHAVSVHDLAGCNSLTCTCKSFKQSRRNSSQ